MKDEKHLAHIRTLPCLICEMSSEVHHVRTYWNAGMGMKPPDRMTLPLCRKHHRQLHDGGERRFWDKHKYNEHEEILKIIIGRYSTPF